MDDQAHGVRRYLRPPEYDPAEMSDPLRSLADAARAVTGAATEEEVLEMVARAARDVIGARHGVARRGPNGAPTGPRLVAPLVARDGSSLGMIELWDKEEEFTSD